MPLVPIVLRWIRVLWRVLKRILRRVLLSRVLRIWLLAIDHRLALKPWVVVLRLITVRGFTVLLSRG